MSVLRSERENGSRRVQLQCDEPTVTEQAHKNHVDINTIVKKYQKTGELPGASGSGTYGDFDLAEDFHDAQNRLIAADEIFMNVPSDIRKRFGNDAGQFLEFVNDPENLVEAQEMGLVPKPKKSVPEVGERVNPPEKPAPDPPARPEGSPAKK